MTTEKALLLWGKAYKERHHALLHHLIDVAAVAEALWDRVVSRNAKERIRQTLKVDDEIAAKKWISFIVGCHDLGKATPVFQSKNELLKARLTDFEFGPPRGDIPHGVLTAALVKEHLGSVNSPFKLEDDFVKYVSYVLGGHHGIYPRADSINRVSEAEKGKKAWTEARISLLENLSRMAGLSNPFNLKPRVDNDGAFFVLLSGLVAVSDWIGSSEDFLTDEFLDRAKSAGDISAYVEWSRSHAQKVLDELSWRKTTNGSKDRTFRELFPFITTPYPLQESAVQLSSLLQESGIVVIEAPMGEGKTEAALFLLDRWNRCLSQDAFFIALPSQATADQMFERVMEYLGERKLGSPVNFALVHGHAVLSDSYQQLRIRGKAEDDDQANVVAEEWFTYRKRGLLSPFGVGTIDQALMAVLPTKHFFVRLFGLAGKTVVIDEVHAYDLYMSKLLDRLLTWLSALGANVILLSATLPSHRREDLLASYLGHKTTVPSVSYPRITWVSGRESGCIGFVSAAKEMRKESATVGVKWIRGEELAERIRSAVDEGGTVAVICDTVLSAQRTYKHLKERFGGEVDLDLLHAKYMFKDRRKRVERCLECFGKGERDPTKKQVLVATQVIEQSLDLDFDLIVSELAPVDLVLQRIGRLHRHHRDVRPKKLSKPEVWLIEPEEEHGIPAFGDMVYVYSEYVLLRSYAVLRKVDKISIPEDIENLVEAAYGDKGPEYPAEWLSMIETAMRAWEADQEERMVKACSAIIQLPSRERPWTITEATLEEDEPEIHRSLQALTRLTPPSVSLVCLFEVDGGLSLEPGGEPLDFSVLREGVRKNESVVKSILDNSVTLTDARVVDYFKGKGEVPEEWRDSALLKHHRLMVLRNHDYQDHYCDCGDVKLILSPELGIVVGEK